MKFEKHEPPLSAETQKALTRLVEFVAEQLPRDVKREEGSAKKVAALLDKLLAYFNEPASREHFQAITGVKESPAEELEVSDDFLVYLLNKLPLQLKERWSAWLDRGEKETTDLLKAVSRPDRGLILGFHVSPNDFGEAGQKVMPGVTDDVFVDPETGKEYHDATAKAWYSLDKQRLYGDKRARYLYLVEGSRQDLDNRRYYDRVNKSVYSHAPLVIRAKVPLTP